MAINLNDFSYTPSVKPITPKDVYGERLSEIPKIIKGLWKIIDFRVPTKGEDIVTIDGIYKDIDEVVRDTWDDETKIAVNSGPRFIVKSIPPRLPYSDTERMDLIERIGNCWIGNVEQKIPLTMVTHANLDKILDDEFAAKEEE